MKNSSENPWLKIPAADYEGHMSSPGVMQLQMLSELFNRIIEKYSSKKICVPGCSAGNGFEHLTGKKIDRITGIDLNPEYLLLCKSRFGKSLPRLELICADISEINFSDAAFDLIHAALIFEYVETETILKKFYSWLSPEGILSVLLQLPSNLSEPVSNTEFESLKSLSGFIKLADPDTFKRHAENLGMNFLLEDTVETINGKNF